MSAKGRIIVLFLAFFLIFSIFADADWPTYQHDEMNTGYANATLPKNLSLLWMMNTTDFGGGYSPSFIWNTPVYAEGKLFITDALGGYLYAINATSGKMIWRCNISPAGYRYSTGAPLYHNGTVYAAVSSYKHPFFLTIVKTTVYAVNASDGKIKWKTILHGSLGLKTSLKVYRNRIILGLGIGKNLPFGILYMLNAENGNILWKRFVIGAIVGSACIYRDKIYVAASPAGYVPYFVNRFRDISFIYCFDLSGKLNWMRLVIGQAKASVSASYGAVYFESLHYFNKMQGLVGGIIYAIDATNGKLKWKREIIDGYWRENDQFSDIAIAYGKLFFNSWDGLFCLDASTGEILWNITYDFSNTSTPFSPPAVCNNRVYVTLLDKIRVVNATTGTIIENIKLPYCKLAFSGGFAIGDGKLFVATAEGRIYCFG